MVLKCVNIQNKQKQPAKEMNIQVFATGELEKFRNQVFTNENVTQVMLEF